MTIQTPSIGFCTTCRNRLWQLKQTLPLNSQTIENTPHSIFLVDYGSTDGLADWIWLHFKTQIEQGKLHFFEVKNPVRWHMSKAKNLAHRISSCDYLFSLDGDNFLTKSDLEKIQEVARLNIACHQFTGNYDGSRGRVGVPKDIFKSLGGYDESMLPMGYQDADFVNRISLISSRVAKLGGPEKASIENSFSHKMSEIQKTTLSDSDAYIKMDNFNEKLSTLKLAFEGPYRTGGYESFIGLFNGRRVLIDGFDNYHSVTWD